MRKRVWFYIVCVLMISFPSLFLMGCKSKKEKVIRLAHSLPTSHPVHQAIEFFKEDLHKKSNGLLRVEIYPNGQLGTEREVLELLQLGSIGLTKVSAATLSNFIPEYKVLGLPYFFESDTIMFEVLQSKFGKDLLNKGQDFRLKGLCFFHAGSRNFYTKQQAIKSQEDLKGLKIRVMNHKASIDMVQALGASATPMAYSELYTALQQNVVDGAENNIPSFLSSKHYELCKHYSFDGHTRIPDVLIIGTSFLESLTEQERQWVQQSANASSNLQIQLWNKAVKKAMVTLKENGVQFHYPKSELFSSSTQHLYRTYTKDSVLNSWIKKIKIEEP